MTARKNALDVARNLIARGIMPVPVPTGAKHPVMDGWQKLEITTDNVEEYFNGARLNVGAIMGPKSGGLTDVDLDCAEAVALAPWFLPRTGSVYGRAGKRRSHYLYKCGDPEPKASIKLIDEDKRVIVELRLGGGGKGAQSIMPGSIHTSGETYEWDDDGETATATCAELNAAIAKIAIATMLVRHWPERNRHEAAMRVGGFLARAGWAPDAIGEFIVAVQTVAGVTDHSHVENGRTAAIDAANHHRETGQGYGMPALVEFFGEAVAKTIGKHASHRGGEASAASMDGVDAIIAEINAAHALVLAGNKAAVMKIEDDGKIRLLQVGAFKLFLANRQIKVGKKMISIADYWLGHLQRRQYEGIEFAPYGGRRGYFNLWRGFAVEPRPGDCSKFLAHMKDNICRGDEKIYDWVIAWWADIFQHPERKCGTSLVIRGPQGIGKTKVGEVFGSLLGEHYTLVSDPRYVTGNFNAHMASLLVLHADEAFWAGDRGAEGKLKDLITGKEHWLEFKGIDPIRVRNYIRLFVCGNPDWLVPAGFDERRFATLDGGKDHKGDHPYFAAIDEEMNNGGREALLHHLLNEVDCSKVNLRAIPKTAALLEQKIASATPEQAWWLETLRAGKLPLPDVGANACLKRKLYKRYIAHANRQGAKRKAIETAIGMFLSKYVGAGLKADQRLTYMTQPYYRVGEPQRDYGYTFPSLKECRAQFAKALQQDLQWAEPDAEWERDEYDSDDEAF